MKRLPLVCSKPTYRIMKGIFSALVITLSIVSAVSTHAQTGISRIGKPEVRITAKVDNTKRTTLVGNTHPYTQLAPDLGAVDAGTPMKRMVLSLSHSDAQEAALNGLMAQQQDKTSPMFHQWLTPAQFGAQFGASDADIKTITDWLTSQGFTVSAIGNGRSTIEFNGTAGQVTAAFQTPIHKFSMQGKTYQANTTDPTIPTALTSVVRGVISLHNFPRDMHHASAGTFQREKTTGKLTRLTAPSKTIQTPAEAALAKAAHPNFDDGSNTNFYALTPYDFATIYNVLPLWNAGIDGTGQNIAVLEETDIHVDDIRSFRSIFGLPKTPSSS
jgi:subtilase family serine protease